MNTSGNYTRDSKPEGERHFSRKQLNYISKLIKTHLSTFWVFYKKFGAMDLFHCGSCL